MYAENGPGIDHFQIPQPTVNYIIREELRGYYEIYHHIDFRLLGVTKSFVELIFGGFVQKDNRPLVRLSQYINIYILLLEKELSDLRTALLVP